MRVIICDPMKPARAADIENTLEKLQEIVGGYIETVPIGQYVIICNEEGKLRNLKPNRKIGHDLIVGTFIFCAAGEDDFADVPMEYMELYRYILDERMVGSTYGSNPDD